MKKKEIVTGSHPDRETNSVPAANMLSAVKPPARYARDRQVSFLSNQKPSCFPEMLADKYYGNNSARSSALSQRTERRRLCTASMPFKPA